MARARRPGFDQPINIRFLDWERFYGDKQIEVPRFLMLSMKFRHDRRWDMPGDQFKFFTHLIALAALQDTPGIIRGDAYSISRECRCRVESVMRYVSRLIETKFIQEVGAQDETGLDQNRGDKISAINLPGAAFETWETLYGSMPESVRFQLGLKEIKFENAFRMAAENRGRLGEPAHLITERLYEEEIAALFPGEVHGFSDFGRSYCRLFLSEPRAVLFMINSLYGFRKSGWDWESNAPRNGKTRDIKKWLYGSFWDYNKDGKTGKYLEFLVYKGKNPTVAGWLHNISDQSPQELVINKLDNIPASISQSHLSGF